MIMYCGSVCTCTVCTYVFTVSISTYRCSYLYDPLGNLYGKNCLNSSIEYLVDPFGRYGADIIAEV